MSRTDITHLEDRTQRLAIDIITLCRAASRQQALWSLCHQLTASAGSVSANHRAMRRARSVREFAAKLQIVHEEADETVHWLEVLRATNRDAMVADRLAALLDEATQLRNIFGRARATTRARFPPTSR
jgi:four helix bundle protein